jgi:hypothetical protein
VDPVADRRRLDELEPLLPARLGEGVLAGSHDDGIHHQAQLVYQVVLDQRPRAAAVDSMEAPDELIQRLKEELRADTNTKVVTRTCERVEA